MSLAKSPVYIGMGVLAWRRSIRVKAPFPDPITGFFNSQLERDA